MYDVVVSTYTKNTDWTDKFNPVQFNVIKYTKNVHLPMSATNINKNIGNEASTYLKHIIENYDCLTEKTVFLHDEEYSWHHHGSIVDLVERTIHKSDYLNLNSYRLGSIYNEYFKILISDYYQPILEPYLGSYEQFGDWTKECKGCAQYIVHKKHIINKPKIMYEELLDWILNSKYGASIQYKNLEAKFMEWTWDIIFLNACPYSESEAYTKYTERMRSRYLHWDLFGKKIAIKQQQKVETQNQAQEMLKKRKDKSNIPHKFITVNSSQCIDFEEKPKGGKTEGFKEPSEGFKEPPKGFKEPPKGFKEPSEVIKKSYTYIQFNSENNSLELTNNEKNITKLSLKPSCKPSLRNQHTFVRFSESNNEMCLMDKPIENHKTMIFNQVMLKNNKTTRMKPYNYLVYDETTNNMSVVSMTDYKKNQN